MRSGFRPLASFIHRPSSYVFRCPLSFDYRLIYSDVLTAVICFQGHFPQRLNLVKRQVTESSFREISERKAARSDPLELDYRTPHMVEHAAHLALPPLMDRNLQPRVHFFLPDFFHLRGRGLAVLKKHSLFKHLDRTFIKHTLDLRQIGLWKFMFRVRDQVREVPVVCHEQQPLGIVVQPADGIDAGLYAFKQVLHRGSSFGIRHGRDIARGLVQHDVGPRLFGINELAVDLYMVIVRVGLGPKLSHHLAINAHPALNDEIFRGAARCHSCGRYDFL
jgi:hypothetical protein